MESMKAAAQQQVFLNIKGRGIYISISLKDWNEENVYICKCVCFRENITVFDFAMQMFHAFIMQQGTNIPT